MRSSIYLPTSRLPMWMLLAFALSVSSVQGGLSATKQSLLAKSPLWGLSSLNNKDNTTDSLMGSNGHGKNRMGNPIRVNAKNPMPPMHDNEEDNDSSYWDQYLYDAEDFFLDEDIDEESYDDIDEEDNEGYYMEMDMDFLLDEFDGFDDFVDFEWTEDEEYCYPEDRTWYTVQEFFVDKATCLSDHVIDQEIYFLEDDFPLDFLMEDMPFAWWEYPWLEHHQPLDLDMTPDQIQQHFAPITDQPHFLIPTSIPPGQVEPIRWRDTHEMIHDDEMLVVGTPPELLSEFRAYFETVGVLELVQHLLYPTTDDNTDNPNREEEEQSHVWRLEDGHRWNVRRASHWPTDMVWFDPADEACYERLYEVMKRGQFDIVLKALQKQLQQPNLVVHGIGAIFNSHFDADPDEAFAQLHRDVPGTRGAFYNILIPIYLPEADGEEASLHIGGDEEDRCAPINLRYNVATVIGSDSWHGTGECDYRSNGGFRLSMSIWVSTITDATVDVISTDGYSPWPLYNDRQWYWAQKDRTNVTNDAGRAPIARPARDLLPDCQEVMGLCDFWDVRFDCPRTCGLYLETEEYYANLRALSGIK